MPQDSRRRVGITTLLLDSNQAVTRDECRAYLVWQHCFPPVLLTALFSLSWCRRRESNPRPRDYETLALPLSYAGTRQFSIVRSIRGECQAAERAFKDRHAHDSALRKTVPEGTNGR